MDADWRRGLFRDLGFQESEELFKIVNLLLNLSLPRLPMDSLVVCNQKVRRTSTERMEQQIVYPVIVTLLFPAILL